MELSWIGLSVCLGVLVFGAMLGDTLIVGLMVSLAFGTTAFVTLTALGGASPLVYVLPTGLVILAAFLRKDFTRRVGELLHDSYAAWLVIGLGVYALVGAYILPRLFQGGAVTLVSTRDFGVIEAPLSPSSGNISQTMYLIFGCIAFIAISVLLSSPRRVRSLNRGYLALAAAIALFGVVDICAKLAGLGDILLGIRTANYALLTESEEAGFFRLVGTFPEASAFAAASLPMLAFSYVHWQRTGSSWTMLLTILLFVLNLISTSSTSLVGLFILSAPVGLSMMRSLSKGRLRGTDAKLLVAAVLLLLLCLGMLIVRHDIFDPFIAAFDRIILSKSQTSSGQERGYWNAVAFNNLFETFGFGVGMGSSRASSWALAVLSQLGLPGATFLAALSYYIWRGVPDPVSPDRDLHRAVTLARGARAAALSALAVGSVSGASADPGLYFFVAVALTHSVRRLVLAERRRSREAPVARFYPSSVAPERQW